MKNFITYLGFFPQENITNTYQKKYSNHNSYTIEIDIRKKSINFGEKIFFNDSDKTTQNITKDEDYVVLECVDRLLTKGYNPQNIILEKVWDAGHGHSGRLDILVTRDDGSAYMMIECKTWGKEFDKAFTKLNKDGGQLFTYFRFDTKADVLVLYASRLDNDAIEYTNQIVKIEDEYRETSNLKDFYDRWNKVPKNNGVFERWTTPYNYKSQALTPQNLTDIKQEDSSFIFNRFMEILRHNVVSDKPNAFSKIFTLFLCKIMDEKITRPNDELGFQWFEGVDDHISFQKRLTDLYQKGMKEFLDKEVTDLSDNEFEEKFGTLDNSIKKQLLDEFTKIRLQKNNEFAIKDVFDTETFEENTIVVKEIVELLQNYKIRYTKKQQFLSDFFELLLTTGLKQEVGQFFTPVPIAKFIIRSIPLDKILQEKLAKGERDELLPNVIDYAVGSGHFITEAMDEIQKYINISNPDEYISDTARKLKSWKEDHFDWAYDYVYGIEKDYRLVKTAKVGCYLHGDGLAKVIHGDGLANFTKTKEYKGKLTYRDKNYPQDNKKFDIVISNPPYSVSAFKNISKKFNSDDFELYDRLTDQSSEIEALFIERTKQLLKDGGIAGIILPNSILSNGGIYSKTREIILKYFEVIGITQLGSNTFMATGTNTVVLFLRRKNNMEHKNSEASIKKLFETKQDITINGIEKPLSKYINYVWEDISLDDYITLLDKNPNKNLQSNELYQEYSKKIKELDKIIELEKEKLFYFIVAYPQKVTIVKTGEKKEEKKFLGYEFSNRRGSEGIHPIQRGKSIDECTSLYDDNSYTNNLKANSYIYNAFDSEFKEIDESLKNNISYIDLVDMMIFDRSEFDKSISLNVKKKVKIESKWEIIKIGEKIEIFDNKRVPLSERNRIKGNYPYYGSTGIIDYINDYIFDEELVLIGEDGAKWGANENSSFIVKGKYWVNNHAHVLKPNRNELLDKYLVEILNKFDLSEYITGLNVPKLNKGNLKEIKIPLPPKDIQEKIVEEVEKLEKVDALNNQDIQDLDKKIKELYLSLKPKLKVSTLSNHIDILGGGTPNTHKPEYWDGDIPWLSIVDFKDNKRYVSRTEKNITVEGLNNSSTKYLDVGDIIISARGTVGALAQLTKPMTFHQSCYGIKAKNELFADYLYYSLKFEVEQFKNNSYGAIFDTITTKTFDLIKIPLPSLEQQKEIVFKIEMIEKEIAIKEQELASIPKQKEDILKKYL